MLKLQLTSALRRITAGHYLSESTVLLLLAVGVGLASGIGVRLFWTAVDLFTAAREELSGLVGEGWSGRAGTVALLTLAGAVVGLIVQRFVGQERHHGVAAVIEAVALGGGRLRYRRMPPKAIAAALSLGAGASVGPEDPAVQIGTAIGSWFGQRLRLTEEHVQLLVAAGAASAIAAAFRAPLAGVFFALEVILNGELVTRSFGVVVLAAVTSSVFTQALVGSTPEIGILTYSLGGPAEMPLYAVLGVLLGPIAVLFIRAVYWQRDFWHAHLSFPRPIQTALAGALVGVAALAVPEIMGPGREVMSEVLTGTSAHTTFGALLAIGLVKLMMTSVSLAGGFQGGIFAPSLFVGTLLGGAFGHAVIALVPASTPGNPQAYAVAGMAAMMAGVVRAPITAILLVFELTNDYRLILPIMLTTVVCVALADWLEPSGIYVLGLLRHGVRLQQGRDVDIMQSITVAEAMTRPAPTIPEDAPLDALRAAFRAAHTRSLSVVDSEGLLAGVVTLTNLQDAFDAGQAQHLRVGDICTRDVITAAPDDALWKAIRLMGQRGIGRLPVVRPGTRELLGVLGRHDIVQAYNLGISRKREQQYLAEQIRLNNLVDAHVFEVTVTDRSRASGQMIGAIRWPESSIVASIQRGGKLIVPHGTTTLERGDRLTIVAAREQEAEVRMLVSADNGRGSAQP